MRENGRYLRGVISLEFSHRLSMMQGQEVGVLKLTAALHESSGSPHVTGTGIKAKVVWGAHPQRLVTHWWVGNAGPGTGRFAAGS